LEKLRLAVVACLDCGASCPGGILEVVSEAPGIACAISWSEWRRDLDEHRGLPHLFVVLTCGRCGDDGSEAVRWWLEFVEVSDVAELRLAPVLVLSPHGAKVRRDIRETTGFDLDLEPNVLWSALPHEPVAPPDRLCERAEVRSEAVRLLTRVALHSGTTELEAKLPKQAFRAEVNLVQATSMLEVAARKLHEDIHCIRSTGAPSVDEEGGQGRSRLAALSRIKALKRRLSLVVSPERVRSFVAGARQYLEGRRGEEERIAAAVECLEESAALLKWQQIAARRGAPGGAAGVYIVDDDQSAAESMAGAIRRELSCNVQVVDVPSPELACAAEQARRCGGDPSQAAADIVWQGLVTMLRAAQACERWTEDRGRFIVVVDVRLSPDAPDAGLWLLRRARDSFPFLRTVAATVRRGLGRELLDEAVDAYVWRHPEASRTESETVEAVRAVLSGGTFCLFPGTELLAKLPAFSQLLTEMHGLERIPADATSGCRLAATTLGDLSGSAAVVMAGGVLVVLVPDSFRTATAFRLTRTLRERGVQLVLMRTSDDGQPWPLPSFILALDRALCGEQLPQHDRRWSLLVPHEMTWGGLQVKAQEGDFAHIRSNLAARFGGATGIDARGLWQRPTDNAVIRDELEMIQVWARGTESGRRHMLDAAELVVRTFAQDEVFLVEEEIKTWNVGPKAVLPSGIATDEKGRLDVPFAFPGDWEPAPIDDGEP